MAFCRPGVHEYELEAELLYAFTRNGSRAPAYSSIVAAGNNACILHYNTNNAAIEEGISFLLMRAVNMNTTRLISPAPFRPAVNSAMNRKRSMKSYWRLRKLQLKKSNPVHCGMHPITHR